LYVHDDESDLKKYADFKRSADELYWVMEDGNEDFGMKIGKTTPFGFPAYTRTRDPEATEKKIQPANQQPVVYLRQYLYPVYIPQILPPQPNMNFYHQPQPQYAKPLIYASSAQQIVQASQQQMLPVHNHQQQFSPPVQHQPIQTQQYCIMRQVPISIQYNANYAYPQVIESHQYNYLAVNYFGGQQ
jgi:hypothetical protein